MSEQLLEQSTPAGRLYVSRYPAGLSDGLSRLGYQVTIERPGGCQYVGLPVELWLLALSVILADMETASPKVQRQVCDNLAELRAKGGGR